MTRVYLDWNIFNKIRHLNELKGPEFTVYTKILNLIDRQIISVPYSNAHINDLTTGYHKNPDFTPGHLDNIVRITKNLCIIQYWKKDHVNLHVRDVKNLFEECIKDVEETPTTYTGLMKYIIDLAAEDWEDMSDLEKHTVELQKKVLETNLNLLRSTPLPIEFNAYFEADPVFEKMYPRSKKDMTALALLDDITELYQNMSKDYSIYKSVKKYINIGREYCATNNQLLPSSSEDGPKHLTFDEALEANISNHQKNANDWYDKINDCYLKLDLRPDHSDDKFANMFNDGLHTFYAAHCNYFVTNDNKCHYKATAAYKQLGVGTKVIKPDELISIFQGQLSLIDNPGIALQP